MHIASLNLTLQYLVFMIFFSVEVDVDSLLSQYEGLIFKQIKRLNMKD